MLHIVPVDSMAMSFRFIHTADIHLDSPLSGLAQYDESEAQEILTASRDALENMVDLAIEEEVAFVVIAGDLYDGDWRDYQTGLFFVEQMAQLSRADIPVYVLHGNHDAESKITHSLTLPDNVFTFPAKAATSFGVADLKVTLHGRSFPKPDVTENLVPDYPDRVASHFNIGVLHTALEGGTIHANYAPVKMTELRNKGYDYWALGHVHQFDIRSTSPHIVYPGNLQGRSIRETGPKGVCLVTVEDGEVVDVVHKPMDVARWSLVTIDVSELATFASVVDAIGEHIRDAVENEADGRLLACRIELVGTSPIHGKLKARIDDIRQETIATTLHLGDTWVEKVKVRTAPAADATAMAEREDMLGELFRALPEAKDDAAFRDELMGIFQDFRSALPHEVREAADDELLTAALTDDFSTLIDGIRDELIADLTRPDGDD